MPQLDREHERRQSPGDRREGRGTPSRPGSRPQGPKDKTDHKPPGGTGNQGGGVGSTGSVGGGTPPTDTDDDSDGSSGG